MTKRQQLLKQLQSGREQSRQAESETWNAHADLLRVAVDDEDRYWLEDRIQDEECELGLAAHPSHISHLLASQGLAYLGDERPAPGPYPYFALLGIGLADVNATSPADRGNGGIGASTWGYVLPTHTAWFAHAVPGCDKGDIEEGMNRMRAELGTLGLVVLDTPG